MPAYGPLNITTREEKGFPLSIAELDSNFKQIANYVANEFTGEFIDDRLVDLLVDSNTSGIDIDYDDDQDQLTLSVDLSELLVEQLVPLFEGGTGISAEEDAVNNQVLLNIDFTEFDTDDITEGTSNIFYTDDRVASKLLTDYTTSDEKATAGVDDDKLLIYDNISGTLQKISPKYVGIQEIAGMQDLGDIDYTASTLLVADGDSFEQMALGGDASLTLLGDTASLQLNAIRSAENNEPVLAWDENDGAQWKMKSKVDTNDTYQDLPIVGFYTISGAGALPSDVTDLGSGVGSLCHNTDDGVLWVRLT